MSSYRKAYNAYVKQFNPDLQNVRNFTQPGFLIFLFYLKNAKRRCLNNTRDGTNETTSLKGILNKSHWFPLHPGTRGPLKKLGQKHKRGSQIEPYRLCYSWNGSLLMSEMHFRSNRPCRKRFRGPFLVYVSNFIKILVWKQTALASGCIALAKNLDQRHSDLQTMY